LELKSAARLYDPDFENSWKRLPFILEMSATLEAELMSRSQSSVQNAKRQAEAACFAQFEAELLSDHAIHRSQVAKVLTESARRKVQLLNSLEAFHELAWNKVSEFNDENCPTWFIKTRDMAVSLAPKLTPWLQQASATNTNM
jgi:hypothetical protein